MDFRKETKRNMGRDYKKIFRFFPRTFKKTCNYTLKPELREELETAVLNLRVMFASMRCLMTGSEALKRENIDGYNCSYVAISRVQAFDEILYVLMNGTGVGFSVERQYITQLPPVAEGFIHRILLSLFRIVNLGGQKAYKELLGLLWIGQIPKWDLSKVRNNQFDH